MRRERTSHNNAEPGEGETTMFDPTDFYEYVEREQKQHNQQQTMIAALLFAAILCAVATFLIFTPDNSDAPKQTIANTVYDKPSMPVSGAAGANDQTAYTVMCPDSINELKKDNYSLLTGYQVVCVDSLTLMGSPVVALTDEQRKLLLISGTNDVNLSHKAFYHELGHVRSNTWSADKKTEVEELTGETWKQPGEPFNTASEILAESYAKCKMGDSYPTFETRRTIDCGTVNKFYTTPPRPNAK